MTKQDAQIRLETIINASAQPDGWHLEAQLRDWENYGKSRTYLAIVETRDCSKHYAKRDYGFIDNQTGEYHPGKHDMTENYNFAGANF